MNARMWQGGNEQRNGNVTRAVRVLPIAITPSVALASDVRHLDFAQRRSLRGANFRVAVGAPSPHLGDQLRDFFVRCIAAQRAAEIRAARGEQTGIELSISGQA